MHFPVIGKLSSRLQTAVNQAVYTVLVARTVTILLHGVVRCLVLTGAIIARTPLVAVRRSRLTLVVVAEPAG